MKTISTEKLNEKFGTEENGEEVEFMEVECENLVDFAENAEFGQCWTDENAVTYFKIKRLNDDAAVFCIDENGDIDVL